MQPARYDLGVGLYALASDDGTQLTVLLILYKLAPGTDTREPASSTKRHRHTHTH